MSSTPTTPPNLSRAVIELLRLVRVLRAEYCAASELLVLALEEIADVSRKLDRLRASYYTLLNGQREQHRAHRRRNENRYPPAQRRAGRTIGDERPESRP